MCLLALYRNCRELSFWQTQKLVEAYGGDHWQVGTELMKYDYPEAVTILEQADTKREQNKNKDGKKNKSKEDGIQLTLEHMIKS